MERLTGLDASFLYFETGTQHLHVCALLVLDPAADGVSYSFDSFKEELGRRLPLVPSMRRRLHPVPFNLDHPMWVEDPHFDLDYHVRHIGVPAPGGRHELAELVAEIASRPLDRTRPLWELWVVEGLADGKVGVVCKYHHAAVDGITGANMMAHLCDIEPGATRAEDVHDDWEPDRQPNDWVLAALGVAKFPLNVGMVTMLPKTIGMVTNFTQRRRSRKAGMAVPFTAPRTPFNKAITPHRAISFTEANLDDVKEIKSAYGVTVNDVVLTVVAGVLREYLDKHGELPDRTLIASVPVSVHTSTRHKEGANKVSTLFSRLYTDVENPVERLGLISEANRGAKEEHKLIGADFLQDWAKYAAPNTFSLAARVYSSLKLAERHPVVHNLVISNVPGPPMPLYFLGVRVDGMYPFGPVFHGAGLTITVLSNNGDLDFGFIACKELVPDIEVLADLVPGVIADLLAAARKHAGGG